MLLYLFLVVIHIVCALLILTRGTDRLIENGWITAPSERQAFSKNEEVQLTLITILIFLAPIVQTIFVGILIYACMAKKEE